MFGKTRLKLSKPQKSCQPPTLNKSTYMPTDQATKEKIEKVNALFKMVSESITRKEFVQSFETILKHLKKLEIVLAGKIDGKTGTAEADLRKLQEEFNQVIKQAKLESDSTFGGIRKRITSAIAILFAKSKIKEKIDRKILEVDEKLATVRDGHDGRDGADGIDGKDGSPDTPEEIVDKLESLKGKERLDVSAIKGWKKVLKRFRKQVKGQVTYQQGGPGGKFGGHMRDYDLSDSLDGGVTRTFSLPAFARIISVQLSSFPGILRKNTDFTVDGSNCTITFTSEIPDNSLAAGQTCVILYAIQ